MIEHITWIIKPLSVVTIVAAAGVATAQTLDSTSQQFGELGSWVVAILIVIVGFLIRQWTAQLNESVKVLRRDMEQLKIEFARQCGRTNGRLEAADHILRRAADAFAEKKTAKSHNIGGAA
jgi:uncharacterized membrane protein